jgi:hypothetical protein
LEVQQGAEHEFNNILSRAFELYGVQGSSIERTRDMKKEVKNFREVFNLSTHNPTRANALIKAFLGRKEGKIIMSEAVERASKDSQFIKSFLNTDEGKELLINAVSIGLRDPKLADTFFNEYKAIRDASFVKHMHTPQKQK